MRILLFLTAIYVLLIMSSFSIMAQDKSKTASAVLAGGCFWCVEADFEKLDGVTNAVSGYAGGERPDPTYDTYNKTTEDYPTPHIEVAKIEYDINKLSYRDILEFHVRHIDPTDGEGQFCDRGPGYRPAIFVENDEQRQIAEDVLAETAETIGQDIDVDILPSATFYPAEEYHQDYAEKSPVRYKFYRWNCDRDQRVEEIWGK